MKGVKDAGAMSGGSGVVAGVNLSAITERLRESTIAVISSARVVQKNPNDIVYSNQLDSAGMKVAEAVSPFSRVCLLLLID